MVGTQGTRGQPPTQHLALKRVSLNRTAYITVPTFFLGTHDQLGPRRPGRPETWWGGRFLQSGQLPDGTERERAALPCRLTAHSYKNRLEIPQAVGQTPTQKKKKSPAFQFFRLKCDLFGRNSLK